MNDSAMMLSKWLLRAVEIGLTSLAAAAIFSLCVTAAPGPYTEQREPCAENTPLRRAYFGDLHIHTRNSFDASTGDTRTGPADAYAFAQGDTLPVQPYAEDGSAMRTLQLARPLDFAAVTDHAELFGELTICRTPQLEGYDTWQCKLYRNWRRAAIPLFYGRSSLLKSRPGYCGDDGQLCREAAAIPWRETQEAANAAYDRGGDCQFTTFVAYEWTGAESGAANMHKTSFFATRWCRRYRSIQ